MSLVESGDDDDGESRMERMAGEEATEALVEVEAAVDRERLTTAASTLTDLQQQVLGFRFAAGLTIRETAEAMGKSEGAVKNLQHNALRMLRRQLDSNEVVV
jgi:RNA polymerase sigma-70 factor (ECF subfamily)